MFKPGSDSTEKIITLTYRGATYEVPKQRVNYRKNTLEGIAELTGKEMIYRGNRYRFTSVCSTVVVKRIGKQLIYSGMAYEI
jgi:hypothetical protein